MELPELTYLSFLYRYVAKYYPVFQSQRLFEVDPLLLPLFIGLCPKNDMLSLIERVPVFLSATWLSVRAHKITSLNKNEVSRLNRF